MPASISPQGTLTLQYQGWIQKITRGIWNKMGLAYPYEDLLSMAYIAALEAEKVFDPTKAKFSTYVKPRIEGALTRAVSNISYTQHKILIRMYAFITTYSEEYGRVPAQHIILKHLEISERQFLNLIDTVNEQIVELDTVTEIESSNGMDMDTLAEYEKVNKLIHKLPKKEFELVQQYLGDPTMKDEKIRHILVGLRASLNLVKEGVIDG